MNPCRIAALAAVLLAPLLAARPAAAARPRPKPPASLVFVDPAGDDDGPGGYVYPTDAAFARGAFDLLKLEIEPGRREVTLRLTFAAPLLDPWNSRSWGGPGFSVQLVHVYLDTEPPPRRGPDGSSAALPGLRARFAEDARWDRAVFISAEAPAEAARRVKAAAGPEAGFEAKAVLVPTVKEIEVDGATLIITLPRKRFGKLPPERWRAQVAVGSTDFYASDDALLAREVLARPGAFRFGGGHDGLCDPNILDLLAPDRAAQRAALKWRCEAAGAGQATLPLVVP